MSTLKHTALSIGAEAIRRARKGLADGGLRFELTPGVGLGPVILRSALEDVTAALSDIDGALEGHRVTTYAEQLGGHIPNPPEGALARYFLGALLVDLDGQARVRHVSSAITAEYDVVLGELSCFDSHALVVYGHMAALEPDGTAPPYDASGVRFPTSGLTLQDAAIEHDILRDGVRPVWGRVGIGVIDG